MASQLMLGFPASRKLVLAEAGMRVAPQAQCHNGWVGDCSPVGDLWFIVIMMPV